MKTAVLMATYNSEKYLAQMLASLLNQSFSDFTCYIHDDGSLDGTLDIIRDYSTSHPNKFVHISDECDHLGAKGNFFHLLKKVEADVYFFADADDVWLKGKMEKSMEALEKLSGSVSTEEAGKPEVPLAVFTDMFVTDEKLKVIHNSFIRELDRDPRYFAWQEIIMDNPAAGCTLCFNRACRDAALFSGDDDRFKKAASLVEMHDVWILITAALLGKVDVVDEPLVHYRQHGDNEMGARSESFSDKVERNAEGLAAGGLRDKKRAYYDNAKNLARAALLLPDISGEKRRVLSGFTNLDDRSWPGRILFLKKEGFRRKKHSLWIWLWA